MKTKELIKKFCEENSDKYTICFSKEMVAERGLGVVVKKEYSFMEMLEKLTTYMEAYLDEVDLGFGEGLTVETLGEDTIVYFPYV